MNTKVSKQRKEAICCLCGRTTRVTFHHLIPKKMHRRARFKKHYSKAQLQTGIYICRLCHDGIHNLYDEMQLAKHFATLEALRADSQLSAHFQWVSKQKVQ